MKQTNAKLVWAPDHNTQHNDVNRQLYHAVSAVATAPVHLGDKHQKRQRTATTPRVNPALDAYNGQGNHQCDIGTSGGLNQQGTATIIDTKVGSPYTHLTDPIAMHGGTHAGGARILVTVALNHSRVPRQFGCSKSIRQCSSSSLFCIGVPVRMRRRRVRTPLIASYSLPSMFLIRWPSSSTIRSGPGSCLGWG